MLTAFHLDADKSELNFKLKNYQRASEVLCELLANVEDRCLQQSSKNAKMLMLCLKASLLLSKVQNIQGQLASSTQVPFKNIIKIQYGPELTKAVGHAFSYAITRPQDFVLFCQRTWPDISSCDSTVQYNNRVVNSLGKLICGLVTALAWPFAILWFWLDSAGDAWGGEQSFKIPASLQGI